MKLEFKKALVISSLHITEEEFSTLVEASTDPIEYYNRTHEEFTSNPLMANVVFEKSLYGCIFYISKNLSDMPEESFKAIPNVYPFIVLAHSNDCQMLILDEDGSIVDGYPEFY